MNLLLAAAAFSTAVFGLSINTGKNGADQFSFDAVHSSLSDTSTVPVHEEHLILSGLRPRSIAPGNGLKMGGGSPCSNGGPQWCGNISILCVLPADVTFNSITINSLTADSINANTTVSGNIVADSITSGSVASSEYITVAPTFAKTGSAKSLALVNISANGDTEISEIAVGGGPDGIVMSSNGTGSSITCGSTVIFSNGTINGVVASSSNNSFESIAVSDNATVGADILLNGTSGGFTANALTAADNVTVGTGISLTGSTGVIGSTKIETGPGASSLGDLNVGTNGITLYGDGGMQGPQLFKLHVSSQREVTAILI